MAPYLMNHYLRIYFDVFYFIDDIILFMLFVFCISWNFARDISTVFEEIKHLRSKICWIVPKKYLLLLDQTILLHFRSSITAKTASQTSRRHLSAWYEMSNQNPYMRSVMCISYCLHDWQTIFIILFSSFWTVDREKKNMQNLIILPVFYNGWFVYKN
jgi:hypothetical protein